MVAPHYDFLIKLLLIGDSGTHMTAEMMAWKDGY
jgi:hypothetical protein